MKFKLFVAIAILFSSFGLSAQVKNIGAGAIVFGNTRLKVEGAKDHGNLYVNLYRPVTGATVFYERAGSGASSMFEVSYSTGALKKVTENDEYFIEGWDPANFHPASVITGFYYLGINNRSSQRFQLPFYFGFGMSYDKASPIQCLSWMIGAKLHAKYYITDQIGVWAGGSAKLGYGKCQVTSSMSRSVSSRLLGIEAGVTFSL